MMKVKFYDIEKRELSDGALKGTIELKGKQKGSASLVKGRLYIKVKDYNLKKMLTQPYPVAIREKGKRGSFYHKIVNCYPGTKDHLTAIAGGCWRFGYVAELAE